MIHSIVSQILYQIQTFPWNVVLVGVLNVRLWTKFPELYQHCELQCVIGMPFHQGFGVIEVKSILPCSPEISIDTLYKEWREKKPSASQLVLVSEEGSVVFAALL